MLGDGIYTHLRWYALTTYLPHSPIKNKKTRKCNAGLFKDVAERVRMEQQEKVAAETKLFFANKVRRDLFIKEGVRKG